MAWTAINGDISLNIVLLYIAAIFWTLGYDTIYGLKDMSDDEIIGLKSTSIRFKENLKLFIFLSYLITVLLILFIFKDLVGINVFTFFINPILCKFILSNTKFE